MAAFLQTYQLPLILACFLLGCLGALTLFRRTEDTKAWLMADVIWVALGGVGAVVAIAAGIYQEDSTALNRQITVAYTASRAFDTDAARFRLRYCAETTDADLTTLCEKVEFLSASSAENTALPLFLTITERAAPLEGISLLFGSARDHAEMSQAAAELEMAEFLAFDTRDGPPPPGGPPGVCSTRRSDHLGLRRPQWSWAASPRGGQHLRLRQSRGIRQSGSPQQNRNQPGR